mgnify:CR=1 FL=1
MTSPPGSKRTGTVPFWESSSIDALVSIGEELPAFDVQVPLMSLPYLLDPDEMDFAAKRPWLTAPEERIDYWSQRLESSTGKRIALVWQGNPNYRADKVRSLALKNFQPILELKEHAFYSLQRDFGSEQLAGLTTDFQIHDFGENLDREAGAFMDSAALLSQLDLLITSDTAIAHLAGALGTQVYLLLPHQPDWRWGINGEHVTKWYPNMRPFVQAKAGDWSSVFKEVQTALSE